MAALTGTRRLTAGQGGRPGRPGRHGGAGARPDRRRRRCRAHAGAGPGSLGDTTGLRARRGRPAGPASRPPRPDRGRREPPGPAAMPGARPPDCPPRSFPRVVPVFSGAGRGGGPGGDGLGVDDPGSGERRTAAGRSSMMDLRRPTSVGRQGFTLLACRSLRVMTAARRRTSARRGWLTHRSTRTRSGGSGRHRPTSRCRGGHGRRHRSSRRRAGWLGDADRPGRSASARWGFCSPLWRRPRSVSFSP